jgi:hypothetical protein
LKSCEEVLLCQVTRWVYGDGSRTDIGDSRSNSDFDTGVALLGELALEELVQFGIENTVSDELATLADSALLGRHFGGVGSVRLR